MFCIFVAHSSDWCIIDVLYQYVPSQCASQQFAEQAGSSRIQQGGASKARPVPDLEPNAPHWNTVLQCDETSGAISCHIDHYPSILIHIAWWSHRVAATECRYTTIIYLRKLFVAKTKRDLKEVVISRFQGLNRARSWGDFFLVMPSHRMSRQGEHDHIEDH